MCGRSRCTLEGQQVASATGGLCSRWVGPSDENDTYRASYNLTPGHVGLVMRLDDNDGALVVQPMRWGLVPSYTKQNAKPDYFRMFNARSESVLEKPVFGRLMRSCRCIVLMNGFYEWKKDGTKKTPYYLSLAGPEGKGEEVMYMAGLYDCWLDAEGGKRHTFTILTTESSKRLQWLHDRMPVLLPTQEARDAWLAPDFSPSTVKEVRVPYDGEDLVWHEVDGAMGSPTVQGPQCCQPIKRPSAASFFQPRRGAAKAASQTNATAGVKEEAGEPKAGVALKPEPSAKAEHPEGLALNPDDRATVEGPGAVKVESAGEGADRSDLGIQATQQESQQLSQPGAEHGVTSKPAAETPKSSSKSAMHAKRAAAGSSGASKPVDGAKKAKTTPTGTSQLRKAAAAKGQRTMAAYFCKNAS